MLALLLRVWVGLVAAVAVGNGVQNYLDEELVQRRVYTLLQKDEGRWQASQLRA